MIVLKSTHQALMELKDKQIADLHEQVRFLRSMVQPSSTIQLVNDQANAILDGIDEIPETIILSDYDRAVLEERDNLLSGNY